ncbi:hypothetical protein KS4_25090 [Poriferisphaera corsica]|uniref:Uncharacterized protein n=1 Tax=Poriferisphaera corsica TaxID=2528020 RepID=A0A517YW60_9BACT|nr:hypothetical protein [Poriferisphaera corsica]QDU34439.1 hypothetical protein KS4_25090 [Poriferisphaera corsica]
MAWGAVKKETMMEMLPSVLLRHEGYGEGHFDWLLGEPGVVYDGDEEKRLWTWRIDVGSDAWEMGKEYAMVRNFDHRARYLSYEGEISGGRGEVRQVDKGVHEVEEWGEGRIVTRIDFEKFEGIAEIRCIKGEIWGVVFKEG